MSADKNDPYAIRDPELKALEPKIGKMIDALSGRGFHPWVARSAASGFVSAVGKLFRLYRTSGDTGGLSLLTERAVLVPLLLGKIAKRISSPFCSEAVDLRADGFARFTLWNNGPDDTLDREYLARMERCLMRIVAELEFLSPADLEDALPGGNCAGGIGYCLGFTDVSDAETAEEATKMDRDFAYRDMVSRLGGEEEFVTGVEFLRDVLDRWTKGVDSGQMCALSRKSVVLRTVKHVLGATTRFHYCKYEETDPDEVRDDGERFDSTFEYESTRFTDMKTDVCRRIRTYLDKALKLAGSIGSSTREDLSSLALMLDSHDFGHGGPVGSAELDKFASLLCEVYDRLAADLNAQKTAPAGPQTVALADGSVKTIAKAVNERPPEKGFFTDANLMDLFDVSENTVYNWRHRKTKAPLGFAEAFASHDIYSMKDCATQYKARRRKCDVMNRKGIEHRNYM
ncbi:MAG: hypothetical protein K6F50_02770 [Kiritimatiellae bacterium]|nr:hypothetical protein [Kiritimatiellia bacterium]